MINTFGASKTHHGPLRIETAFLSQFPTILKAWGHAIRNHREFLI